MLHCREISEKAGKHGGFRMLRLTVSPEEYLMIGDDIKIVFLGGSKNHTRIMLDIPNEVRVVRSKVMENAIKDEKEKAKLPHYHAVPDLPEKYRKKKIVINDAAKVEKKKNYIK